MAATLSPQLFGAILVLFLLHPFAVKSRPVKLESFENVQKGDVVYGISQVKQYLRDYGYYPREVDPTDDRFDDALESALKTYQKFYRMNVTGKIDSNMIKAMSTPRCGVPDINLEQTSNYVIIDRRLKFYKSDITYSYLSNSTSVSNLAQFKQAIARAFGTWRSSTNKFKFSEVQGNKADMGIGFYRGNHGDTSPFDGRPSSGRNTLAHATPAGSRNVFLHFDAAEKWTTNPTTTDDTDLETVALHEIGHNLGLDHSGDSKAVMFADYQPGSKKRTLTKDDIDGIMDLYK